jgi:GNAT superfamily N-acetyltransferase
MTMLLKRLTHFSWTTVNKRFYSLSPVINKETNIELNGKKFSMRHLCLYEFKKIIDIWAVKEGWNPGLYEYLPFFIACPQGHTGLFFDNKLIASLSAVRYSKDLAFLGLYIVDPDYRSQGVGQVLAKATLEELADCSLIGLNAVQQQIENYQKKYGFIPYHNNSRWSGQFGVQDKPNSFLNNAELDIKIISKENLSINQLIDYDASVFSIHREAFLRKWIEMPESSLLAAIKKDKICGYGVISKCVQGYKLAPFFADDKVIAEKLYSSLALLMNKNTTIQLDIPENNQTAVELATQFGLYKILRTTRMYKGREELINKQTNENIYALTTLEIG